ncbi:MAG: DsbA family protein [Actinomycetota bacterium]
MANPTRSSSRTPSPALLTVGVLLVAGVVVALLLAAGGDGDAVATDTPGEDPTLGDSDAPVVVVEYSDFGCPYCGAFARDTKPVIEERYIDEGVVRYVWRDLPYQGEPSRQAAMAGREAHAQGRFWEFHDALFAEQEAGLSADRLRSVAADVGLDLDAFEEAMAAEAHAEAVEASLAEGQELGLTGTPAFTINGEVLIGAQPLEVFTEAIDAAAEQAS